MTDQPLYTLRDIARELQLPESTVRYYRDAFSHHLPTVGTGRRRRYPQDAVASLRLIAMWYAEGRSREEIEHELAGHPTAEIHTPRPRIPYRDAERPTGGLGPNDVLQTVLEGERERRHAMWQMAREIVRLSEMLDRQQTVLDDISDRLTVLSERALPSGAAAPAPTREPPAAPRPEPVAEAARPEPKEPEEPIEEPMAVGLGVDSWAPEPPPVVQAPEPTPPAPLPPVDTEPALEPAPDEPVPAPSAYEPPVFRPSAPSAPSAPRHATDRESLVVPDLDPDIIESEWEPAPVPERLPEPPASPEAEAPERADEIEVDAEAVRPEPAAAEPPAAAPAKVDDSGLVDLREQLESLREELANEKDLVERLRRSKLELERRTADAEERASLERGGRRSMFGRLLGGGDDE